MSGLVLDEHPLSPYAQKVRILLREKDLPFETRLPRRPRRGGESLGPLLQQAAVRDHRLEWMIKSGGMQVVLDGLAKGDIRFTDTARFADHGRPASTA